VSRPTFRDCSCGERARGRHLASPLFVPGVRTARGTAPTIGRHSADISVSLDNLGSSTRPTTLAIVARTGSPHVPVGGTSLGGESDGVIAHLACHRPSSDVGLVEVVHDGGPVHVVPAGQCVDRGAVSVLADFGTDAASLPPEVCCRPLRPWSTMVVTASGGFECRPIRSTGCCQSHNVRPGQGLDCVSDRSCRFVFSFKPRLGTRRGLRG